MPNLNINQILLIFLLLIIISYIIIYQINIIRYKRKIHNFAYVTNREKSKSIIELVISEFNKFRKNIANSIDNIRILNKMKKKYEMISTESGISNLSGAEVISSKIMILITVILTMIVISLYTKNDYTVITIIASLIGWNIPNIRISLRKKSRVKNIELEILNALNIMNGGLQSGKSITQAVKLVADELNGDISNEFKKIYKDIGLGMGVSEAFERFSKRVPIEEVKLISNTVGITTKLGGEITKVFNSIEVSILNRKRIDDEINATTATARNTIRIMLGIPFALAIFISFINRDYFNVLFTTRWGYFILGLILLLNSIALIVSKIVLKVDI